MNDLAASYVNFGGYSFIKLWPLWTALIILFVFYVAGIAYNEYATGRSNEFSLGVVVIRLAVVLISVSYTHLTLPTIYSV